MFRLQARYCDTKYGLRRLRRPVSSELTPSKALPSKATRMDFACPFRRYYCLCRGPEGLNLPLVNVTNYFVSNPLKAGNTCPQVLRTLTKYFARIRTRIERDTVTARLRRVGEAQYWSMVCFFVGPVAEGDQALKKQRATPSLVALPAEKGTVAFGDQAHQCGFGDGVRLVAWPPNPPKAGKAANGRLLARRTRRRRARRVCIVPKGPANTSDCALRRPLAIRYRPAEPAEGRQCGFGGQVWWAWSPSATVPSELGRLAAFGGAPKGPATGRCEVKGLRSVFSNESWISSFYSQRHLYW
jgi:hypothetical protein